MMLSPRYIAVKATTCQAMENTLAKKQQQLEDKWKLEELKKRDEQEELRLRAEGKPIPGLIDKAKGTEGDYRQRLMNDEWRRVQKPKKCQLLHDLKDGIVTGDKKSDGQTLEYKWRGLVLKIVKGVYKGQLCEFRQILNDDEFRVALQIKSKMIRMKCEDLRVVEGPMKQEVG